MLLSNRDTGDRMIACSFSRLGEAESFALRKSCRSRRRPPWTPARRSPKDVWRGDARSVLLRCL